MSASFPRRLAAACCLFPLAATAQSASTDAAVPTLRDIVVTASRSPEPLADVVGDVTVIGPKQLAEARGDSIAEIIGRAPGVQFTTTGGPQTQTGIYLRGNDPKHTLVLVDGMRVNNTVMSGTDYSTLDPAMIDHIEILRGAASSLYGSDAIGGVVNIITKKGAQDRPLSAWANVGYGSYETAKSSLGLSGAAQGWDYSLAASAERSKGFNATRKYKASNAPNTQYYYPDNDGYHNHTVSGTLGYHWAPGHHIGLTAYNRQSKNDYDAGDFAPDAYAFARQQAYGLSSTDRITDWWDSDLRFGFTKEGYDDRAYSANTNLITRQYSWINTFKPHPDHQLSVLLERREDRVQSTNVYDRTRRDTNAAALIYKGRIDRLHTQASIRNDNYSDYGNQTTGSLGLDFDLTDVWQIGIAANTGFRAPTFADLYWPFEDYGPYGSFSGNPNLKPEKSRNLEAHVRYQTADTRVTMTVYRNRVQNLINGNVCDALFNCTAQNVNQATLQGLTLAGEHDFGDTAVRLSADFLAPRNDDPQPAQGYSPAEGSTLPNRARQVFHLGVEHRIQAWKLGAEYQYTGNRYADVANKTRLGGYSLVNLTAAYDFSKSLGVQVRWNNVLDKDYVLVDGYNTPGSNVFVNLSWRM
ncbi:TonB-dependent receptor OS=Castellaniella sp OX=1955812 GN=EPN31_08550 PE=3 SV=1 [Castellaniella denitrificans]